MRIVAEERGLLLEKRGSAITNESIGKRPTYAALGVREIWRYDGAEVSFHGLAEGEYRPLPDSLSFPGLRPDLVAEALAESTRDGQTAALQTFRRRLRSQVRT